MHICNSGRTPEHWQPSLRCSSNEPCQIKKDQSSLQFHFGCKVKNSNYHLLQKFPWPPKSQCSAFVFWFTVWSLVWWNLWHWTSHLWPWCPTRSQACLHSLIPVITVSFTPAVRPGSWHGSHLAFATLTQPSQKRLWLVRLLGPAAATKSMLATWNPFKVSRNCLQ